MSVIVGAENLLKTDSRKLMFLIFLTRERFYTLICLFLVTVLFLLVFDHCPCWSSVKASKVYDVSAKLYIDEE